MGGKTVYHCHFLTHEDAGMIENFMLTDGSDASAALESDLDYDGHVRDGVEWAGGVQSGECQPRAAHGDHTPRESKKVREGNKRGLAKLAKHLAEGRAKKVAKLKAKILKAEKAEEKAPHTPKKRKDTEAEKITKKINNAVKVKKAQMSAALRRELAKAHEADRVKLAHIKDVETKAQKRTAKKVSNKIKNAIKAVNGSSKKPREEKPKA